MQIDRALIRGVQSGDIEYLGTHMHSIDTEELQVSYPELTPERAVQISVESSLLAFTATWDGVPAVMFGVCPTEAPGIGRAWLLNDMRKAEYGKSFLKLSLEYIEVLQRSFESIFNHVWVKHRESLLWLKRLGFEDMVDIENYNGYGETFKLMVRTKGVK